MKLPIHKFAKLIQLTKNQNIYLPQYNNKKKNCIILLTKPYQKIQSYIKKEEDDDCLMRRR